MNEVPVWKTILIFVGLGPLFGYLFVILVYVSAIMASWGTLQQHAQPLKPEAVVAIGFLFFGALYAYVLGGAAALTAGLVAAFLMTKTGRKPFWIGPISGLASLLTSLVLIVFLAPFMVLLESIPFLLGAGALHVIAATLCWIVVRRRAVA